MVRQGKSAQLLAVLVLALCWISPSWADVQASIDKTKLFETETLNLTIIVSGDNSGVPNLNGVKENFEVVSTSESNSYSYVNGQMSSKHSWYFTLAPKRQGQLEIPAIPIGDEMTKAMPVEVLAPSAANHMDEVPGVFMETSLEPESDIYVQSQVAFSVKIFYATELQSGRLTDLTVDNAVAQRLGDDKGYQALRHGKRYNVIERSYAIFPQASGEIEIPSVVFQGSIRVAQSGQRSRGAFFDPFGRLSGGGQQVRVKSDAVTLQVKPRPNNVSGPWWLPARDVKLGEAWSPAQPEFRVGEPVTRTITMQAQGLSSAQLPELSLGEMADIKFYPDQSVTQDTDDGVWITGIRQQKVALVPSKAGDYTLPAIEVYWWDTQANSERVATLPERRITVLPALNAVEPPSPVVQPELVEEPQEVPVLPLQSFEPSWKNADHWLYIALLSSLGWLLTLIAWWRARGRAPVADAAATGPSNVSLRKAKQAIKQACNGNDAEATRTALLSWAKLDSPGVVVNNLADVATLFEGSEIKALLLKLDAVLYSSDKEHWQGMGLWQALAAEINRNPSRALASNETLKALYPSGR